MKVLSRKDFITQGALWAGGAILGGNLLGSEILSFTKKRGIGLQLYTLREPIRQQGIAEILRTVSEIGYNEVETFGYSNEGIFGKTPVAFKKMCDDNNIAVRSGHYLTGRHDADMTGTLVNGWDQAIQDAKKMGQKYMVIAWLHPSERKTLDDYKKLTDMLNKAGEQCKKEGIQFAYHNHDFEFEMLEGKRPYDLLLEQTDEDLVKMELDLYWIVKAGHEPLAYFKKYPGRFPLWHVKDLEKETGNFTEVGNGIIDFKSLFEAKKRAGLDHFFVEQDVSKHPLKSIKISYGNVTNLV